MFRPSDVRRVQAAFDAAIPAPYEAEVTLADGRMTMNAIVMDPDDPALPVVRTSWPYEAGKRLVKQPSDAELAVISTEFIAACTAYPEAKAANEAQLAERVARQETHAAARLADAKAQEEEAERRLKSAAAKVLAAGDITPDMVDAIQDAAADPALG